VSEIKNATMSKHHANTPIAAPSITQHMHLFSSPLPTTAHDDDKHRTSATMVTPYTPHHENDQRETTTRMDWMIDETQTGIQNDDNYDLLKKEISIWIRDLESIRDQLHRLQIENAFMLDTLAMAGVDTTE
jgi:hypothetical protein